MFQFGVLPGGFEAIWESKLDVGDEEEQESIFNAVFNCFFVSNLLP